MSDSLELLWHTVKVRFVVVTTALSALCLAPGGCDCGETVVSLEADIVVSPEAVAFSRTRVGSPATATVTVANRGTGRLELALSIDPEGEGFAVDPAATDSVAAGAAGDVVVSFTAPARAPFAADLVIASNDPDTPVVRVPLSGEGGPPILAIAPSPIDLGLVNEGVGASVAVELRNAGFDVLALASAALAGGAAFAVDSSALPAALTPDESVTVVVSLDPDGTIAALEDAAGNLVDSLVVTHADGVDDVPVIAQVNLAPVAVAVEQITRRDVVKVAVASVVNIDGSESADPEGDAFTFTWTLVERPAPSSAVLIGQGQPTTRVTPDVVGRYLVALRVVDEHGAAGDADVEILPRDLSVVLTWSADAAAACTALSEAECDALPLAERQATCCDNSDLDLHLVRPGGTLGDYGVCPAGCAELCGELGDENADTCRSFGTDCAWDNSAPEWGVAGRIDDPRLDVDDVRGRGPEIISLDEPEDGIYRVTVHYCRDRVTAGEPTLATVEVFEAGASIFVSGPELLVEGDAWSAVTLTRTAGAWEPPLGGPGLVVAAPPGLCPPSE